jgi:hypothetical protein
MTKRNREIAELVQKLIKNYESIRFRGSVQSLSELNERVRQPRGY